MFRLSWEVARRSFRRAATYRVATASGVFVNTVFGYVRAYVLVYVAAQNGDEVAGLSGAQLATFAFASQAMIMVVGVFSTSELADRIRSGDIEVDLYRPADLQIWEAATWLGRAVYLLAARGLPPLVLGSVAFDLQWPDRAQVWFGFLVATALGSLIGFSLRFLTGLVTFWLLDTRGINQMLTIVIMFFGGMLVPVDLFPAPLEEVARNLPFAAMVQYPVEIFLGRHTGWALAEVLARQLAWLAVLALAGRLVLSSATRRVVVQGG